VELCHSVGIRVCVEGVETTAELAALQPAEETDGNTEPAADSAEEPQSEPDSANGENAG